MSLLVSLNRASVKVEEACKYLLKMLIENVEAPSAWIQDAAEDATRHQPNHTTRLGENDSTAIAMSFQNDAPAADAELPNGNINGELVNVITGVHTGSADIGSGSGDIGSGDPIAIDDWNETAENDDIECDDEDGDDDKDAEENDNDDDDDVMCSFDDAGASSITFECQQRQEQSRNDESKRVARNMTDRNDDKPTVYKRGEETEKTQMSRSSMNFRDIEDSIRWFDGSDKIDVEVWLGEFEETSTLMRWDEF
ncbi:PREDICTED: skeletal aspartic acid-rich protein 1-like [Bactrocera latifrons]|uniref:skeletal aspartic acid-rich protein 1-like n=1 Tax=Bactrocera latifrons TaxID=174628 RepID=UPI0008DDA5A0|nr:PREDICTED: skeletal aspartic acid-rich protein 1-like [Bactrocera latifrons]